MLSLRGTLLKLSISLETSSKNISLERFINYKKQKHSDLISVFFVYLIDSNSRVPLEPERRELYWDYSASFCMLQKRVHPVFRDTQPPKPNSCLKQNEQSSGSNLHLGYLGDTFQGIMTCQIGLDEICPFFPPITLQN